MRPPLSPFRIPVLFFLFALAAPSAHAVDATLNIPIMSAYVSRGLEYNSQPVLQPSLTLSGNGLTFNLWGNLDLTEFGEEAGYGSYAGEFSELDLSLEYAYALGPVSLAAGLTSYAFPGLIPTTYEYYGRLAADIFTCPALIVYADVDNSKCSYWQFGMSHRLSLAKLPPLNALTLGLTAGFASESYNQRILEVEKNALVELVGFVSLAVDLPGGFTLTPIYSYGRLPDPEISTARGANAYQVITVGISTDL